MIDTETRNLPAWPHPTDRSIVPAFRIGEKVYYRFPTPEDMPPMRALQATAYYDELSMRMDRNTLLGTLSNLKALLNAGNLVDAAAVVVGMEQRVDWVYEPDIVYKLATVMYFTAEEDPYSFDMLASARTVQAWKEQLKGQDYAFFLSMPIRLLLPGTVLSSEDMQTYLAGFQALKKRSDSLLLPKK